MQIRYTLLLAFSVYWAGFALFTLAAARKPGLSDAIEGWTYPWGGVFAVWATLAVMLAGLYLVLWPRSSLYVARRLKWGLLYTSVLAVLGLLSNVTCMPGHIYVPIYSSWLVFIVTLSATANTSEWLEGS